MNIRPLHDRVIVERQEVESKVCWWHRINWFSCGKINTWQSSSCRQRSYFREWHSSST